MTVCTVVVKEMIVNEIEDVTFTVSKYGVTVAILLLSLLAKRLTRRERVRERVRGCVCSRQCGRLVFAFTQLGSPRAF